MDILDLLKRLSEAPGVSGDEGAVRSILREAIEPHVDEIRVDALGNLIAVRHAAGDHPMRVMVAAHMDEVGLMVIRLEKNGGLRFRKVGGIDDRILPSKVVRVGKDGLPGVIGVKPIHLLSGTENKRVLGVDDLFIDIGVSSEEEAGRLVKRGDRAVFATDFADLGPRVKGRAFDDRAGCAVLAQLLAAGPYPVELYAVFTVQEEIGLRGARVAAYEIDPDVAFVLEGTVADDLPKEKDESPTTELGKGPALTVMDRSVFVDPRLLRFLIETAAEEGIPYQLKQPGVGGTDAGRIHLAREGVPSAVAAVPCRYIHGPASLLDKQDLQWTVQLMEAALRRLSPAVLER
ncbi:MAG: M42 family metallopeptidase [Chloroflexi bacterium]|nr:M42 family metallopeptidase [Chloroflexota bacterium]